MFSCVWFGTILRNVIVFNLVFCVLASDVLGFLVGRRGDGESSVWCV